MKNFIKYSGIVAAILVMFAFSIYYIGAKEYADYFSSHLERVNGLYFIFSCLAIGTFSGILFYYFYNDVFISSIYLLCTLFFDFLLMFTFYDWIANNRIRMDGVYFSIIVSMLISIVYILIKIVRR